MNNNDTKLYALIYNRVSSTQQESDGSGLISQRQRCITYAENKGYIIGEQTEIVFRDTFTGGGDFMRRPAMRKLLEYIDKNPRRNYVVIFDDLKRFARDTKFHIELRSAFNARKVKVECLNFNFEDTPEGTFVETILAAQNQLEREQNQRQVIQKQKARLQDGYWAFPSPLGYTMKKIAGLGGKVAVLNEFAPVIKETLEGYAQFRFMYQIDVVRFLRKKGMFPNQFHDERYVSTVSSLLRNPFYAGFIEFPKWDVARIKGVHEPLIDEDTYNKNLARLAKPAYVKKARIDDNPEFELRGLINCTHCNRPFTAAFSLGRKKLYPYYLCQTPGCIMYKKSGARDNLNKDFEAVMNKLKPEQEVIGKFTSLFEEAWQAAVSNFNSNSTSNDLSRLEKQIDEYVEMSHAATNVTARNRYEQKIELLENQIKEIKENTPVVIDLSIPYRTALEKVTEIAKSPYKIWTSATLPERKKLFFFFFDTKIKYDLKTRYRTVNPSVLYRFFGDFSKKSVDVEMGQNISNHFTELYEFILKWGKYLDGNNGNLV